MSPITIHSFLKSGDAFILATDFDAELEDDFYIEGYIDITYGEQKILTAQDWDLVDQLWCYLIDGLAEVVRGNSFSTYFPDQPLEIALTPDAHFKTLEFTVKAQAEKRFLLPYHDCMIALLQEAQSFLDCLCALNPAAADSYRRYQAQAALIQANLPQPPATFPSGYSGD
ncbi:MAG: hypothetical protein AAGG51_20540 [Cyanobacteria bacterium P01_G01_bin.54]